RDSHGRREERSESKEAPMVHLRAPGEEESHDVAAVPLRGHPERGVAISSPGFQARAVFDKQEYEIQPAGRSEVKRRLPALVRSAVGIRTVFQEASNDRR